MQKKKKKNSVTLFNRPVFSELSDVKMCDLFGCTLFLACLIKMAIEACLRVAEQAGRKLFCLPILFCV